MKRFKRGPGLPKLFSLFKISQSLASVLWPVLFLVNRWHPFYGQVCSWLIVGIRFMTGFVSG